MPWEDNPAWDEAVARNRNVALAGEVTQEIPARPSTRSLHRPHDLLVSQRELERADIRARLMRQLPRGTDDAPDPERREIAKSLGFRLFHVPDANADLPALVRRLREIAPAAAALNTVMVAGPQRHGGDSPPKAATAPEPPVDDSRAEGRTIVVLDTGIVADARLGVAEDAANVEHVAVPPDPLGVAAGHGTFVAGIIRQHAPGATILARCVLKGSEGIADELEVAAALDALPPADIVNMSFGGFAVDRYRMLALEVAVERVRKSTLLVAAAGNHTVDDLFYPAAYKRVVAVGAVEQGDRGWVQSSYTNFGSWVDCCSEGTDVTSNFVHYAGNPTSFAGGAIWSGTSFAAPRVSAAVAVKAKKRSVHAAAHLLLKKGSATGLVGQVGRPIF